MDTWQTGALLLAAAATQGFFGFGYGILAMGMLVLAGDLIHAAGLVNLTGFALTTTMAFMLRKSILWGTVGRILPWSAVGVAAGLWLLEGLSREFLVRLLGLCVVGISLWNLRARTLVGKPSGAADGWAGLGSGVLSGAFNIGGPPLIAHLYRFPHPPDALRGTVQTLFFFTSLVRLCGATLRGQITAEIAVEALGVVPFVIAGAAIGIGAGRRVTAQRFRAISWVAFACLGIYLTVVG